MLVRRCPWCGNTERDARITSHTHYYKGEPFVVPFIIEVKI